jgi:undecaprenyl-diphosphatase
MNILEAIILGIIQGLSEFLPVSSSGHLSLASHFFNGGGDETVTMIIVLHLGTLLSVTVAFWSKLKELAKEAFSMLRDIPAGRFRRKGMNPKRRFILMLIVSLLPLCVFYVFKDFFENIASDDDIITEGFAFIFTALLLFVSSTIKNGKRLAGETTVRAALFIGVCQGVALVPGISRSGSTISAGLMCGLKRSEAVEYSFILSIPVILAGAVVKLGDPGFAQDLNIMPLLVGFAVSAAVGYFSVRIMKYLVGNGKFVVFAWYTLILGIITICAGVFERMSVS